MKRLILYLLLLSSFAGFSQQTDASLTTQADVIRNETVPGANTKGRIADMHQSIIDSKFSLVPWVTSTSYTANKSSVVESNILYKCIVTHTSGTFATDLAANRWVAISESGGGGAVSSVFSRTGAVTATAGDYTGTQVTNTPAGTIAAVTVQAALNELDTDKATTASVDAKVADAINNGTTTIAPSQNAVYDALILKGDALITANVVTGAHTLDATDLGIINLGGQLDVQGNSGGALTIPLNSSVAFPVGSSLSASGFTGSVIATGGVTITGTRGDLVFPSGASIFLIKTATDTWTLNNGLPTGTSSTAGLTKLYTTTGTNTDGAMDQNSAKTALDLKQDVFGTQTANTIYSGPTSGSAATPTFRAAVIADTPNEEYITESTTSRTLAASDRGKVIRCTNSATTTITLPNSIASGFSCVIVKAGTGDVILSAATTLEGSTTITGTAPSFAVVLNRGSDIWVTNGSYSSVSVLGTIDSQTKSANGAVISGSNLYLQNADGTYPGLVSTAAQTFTGDKTIDGNIILKTLGQHFAIKEGTNGWMGQTTLVSGTKAITVTGVTTSSRCFLTRVTPSGTTLTIEYDCVCTSNTVTITAAVAAGTINTADTSVLNYEIKQPAP